MKIKLINNSLIPQLGFGVFLIKNPETCKKSVLTALNSGYRLIDTAAIYKNEVSVGEAIRESGIDRSEIYLTTKIWVSDYGYEKTKVAIDDSLKRLNVGYIDLLLLHQGFGDYVGSWKALEEAVKEGKVRAIGISNFGIKETQEILNIAKIKPVVNQVECHPYFQQKELKAYLEKNNIALEAWYPIGHGSKKLLNEDKFKILAEKYGKSVVQIILRWHIQEGNVTIPKSTNKDHIKSNIEIFDFELSLEEMKEIRAMDKNKAYLKMPVNPVIKYLMKKVKTS